MSESKRKAQDSFSTKKKRKYRSDGTPIWSKPHIDGPGIWASCVKGKEKQAVGELYDLFDSAKAGKDSNDLFDEDTELSIEEQIAKEVASMRRPRRDHRFMVFISCKPPIDPVQLVVKHIENVEATGIARTRYTHRLVPVSGNCVANIPEISALCRKVFDPFFSKNQDKMFKYKIELRVRNHNTIPRPVLIQAIAKCVPEGHTVELTNPDIFILVEVFKSVCGISIVKDYYRLQKFNVMELANFQKAQDEADEGVRVSNTKALKDMTEKTAE
ncbi:hypothetical protein BDQ17DRAFT_1399740 [Cyathus striatus]|nr:hypothetical protein BDQ17DRAFT_1399740 [Cyathus striatus]